MQLKIILEGGSVKLLMESIACQLWLADQKRYILHRCAIDCDCHRQAPAFKSFFQSGQHQTLKHRSLPTLGPVTPPITSTWGSISFSKKIHIKGYSGSRVYNPPEPRLLLWQRNLYIFYSGQNYSPVYEKFLTLYCPQIFIPAPLVFQ
jgi:hypothetical protein